MSAPRHDVRALIHRCLPVLLQKHDVLRELWDLSPDKVLQSVSILHDMLARAQREHVSVLVNMEYALMNGRADDMQTTALRQRLEASKTLRIALKHQIQSLSFSEFPARRTILQNMLRPTAGTPLYYTTTTHASKTEEAPATHATYCSTWIDYDLDNSIAAIYLTRGHEAAQQRVKELVHKRSASRNDRLDGDASAAPTALLGLSGFPNTVDKVQAFVDRVVQPAICVDDDAIQSEMLTKMQSHLCK